MSINGLKGCRVLLVEDEMIVAMEIEEVLHEAGCVVVGPVGTLQSALLLAREAGLDAAVLDVNLDGERAYSVAEVLQARGVPIILATGYNESTLPEQWRSLPRLTKPFVREQLLRLIVRTCNHDTEPN